MTTNTTEHACVTPAGRGANNTGSSALDHLRNKTQDKTPAEARSDVKFIFLTDDTDPLQNGISTEDAFEFSLDAVQPAPVLNAHPAVWPLVMQDMVNRDCIGRRRYGVPLQPHNGRDMLRDAYEEALDLAVYLRGAIYERDAA